MTKLELQNRNHTPYREINRPETDGYREETFDLNVELDELKKEISDLKRGNRER